MSFPASKVLSVCRAQRVFTSTGLSSLSLCPWNLLALTTAVPHFSPSLFLLCTHIFAFLNILPFQCTISMPLMLRQIQAIVFDRICWKGRQAGTCTSPSRQLSSMRSMVLPCLTSCPTPCPLLPSPRDTPALAPLPPTFLPPTFQLGKCFPDTEVSTNASVWSMCWCWFLRKWKAPFGKQMVEEYPKGIARWHLGIS